MNIPIIKNKDIIVVGQQPWDIAIGSNCKNIALEFSKYNRVLYVNMPLDRISSIRDKKDPKIQRRIDIIKGKENGLIKVQENLWNLYPDCLVESINWIAINPIFDWINRRNTKKFVATIQPVLKELNFTDYLLFNDNEIIKCFYLKEYLKPALSIYYSRDYILGTDYWKKRGKRLEPLVISKSDLCVTNSTYLMDYCKQYNTNTYYVGQGCELEIFQGKQFGRPSELKNIGHPIVGYVGALLGSRLDISILQFIAQQKPNWNVVLVGPEDNEFKNSALHKLKNVFFIGSKPAEQLPDFINTFDVCINPQKVNQLTVGNYPRKVDEYLAMGKPVVATNTQAMDIFKAFVHLANNNKEFVQLVEKALREQLGLFVQQRKDFAATHTWQNSVTEIYSHINMH